MTSATIGFCDICDKKVELSKVYYTDEDFKWECTARHFKCEICDAGYSSQANFISHASVHEIESTWRGIVFENSSNPQNLVDMELREIGQSRKYAKKGIMYGSACWTDFVCALDGLEEAFNGTELDDGTYSEGLSVEDGLHKCALMGYDVGYFDYILSKSERIASMEFQHKQGWGCHFEECEECS